MFDKLLEKSGLKYEDLNAVERETMYSWVNALEENTLTLEKIREYIHAMRDGVEQEVTGTSHDTKRDIFLKARLRNYMLLEAFLSTPEKARAQIEKALGGITSSRK